MMKLEQAGTIAVAAATILVAASILAERDAGRILNGLAGLTWFASAGFLGVAASRVSGGWQVWSLTVAMTGLVACLVKPSDFVPAVVGFGLAGGAMALVAGRHGLLWAKLVVALYLPFHIGSALARAMYRAIMGNEAAIRSDPPPTAAVIPMVMLLAAICGALVAREVLDRYGRRQSRMVQEMRRT